jgi:hypothetical protein
MASRRHTTITPAEFSLVGPLTIKSEMENTMNSNSSLNNAPAKRSWPRRILKAVGITIASCVVLLGVAHLVWRGSGSGQWELEIDRDGIQVYSMKSPGSSLKKFRGTTKIKSQLNSAVASMMDASLENCQEWISICASSVPVEPWNPQGLYYIQLYQENFPEPFGPREFLLKTKFSQDSQTKTVRVEFKAEPDKLPRNECCARIEHMNNVWQFTPLPSGELQVELVVDIDIGLPYFMFNQRGAEGNFFTLQQLPAYFNKEKYMNTTWDFITL